MSSRLGFVSLIAAGFFAAMIVTGCGGGSAPTGEGVAAAPQSEVDYQKEQEKLRKENLSRTKSAAKAVRK